MRSHIDNLSTLDLITAVVSKIPIDTTTSFMEANVVKKDIMDAVYSVSSLTGLAFLNSTGKIAKSSVSVADANHTKDLAYLRLSCTIDSNLMDQARVVMSGILS